MSYDCNKTLDFSHEKKRMCFSYNKCAGCPLLNSCHDAQHITKDDIIIVQKWSDAHPDKTRADAFNELFPKFSDNNRIHALLCFHHLIGEKCPKKGLATDVDTECRACWNEPYNGEFEKEASE